MRRIWIVLVLALLLCGVAGCSGLADLDMGKYFGSIQVLAAETPDSTTQVAGNLMAVFYTKAGQRVLLWCSDATIRDNGDGTWDVTSPQVLVGGIQQSSVDYGLYKYSTDIPSNAYIQENDVYLADLNLQAITWDDLPQSLHVAALESVGLVAGSPRATVTRLFMGMEYQIPNCRVSLQAYAAYTAGQITVRNHSYGFGDPENANCFVLVYFITEVPFGTEVNIPVVIDRVIK